MFPEDNYTALEKETFNGFVEKRYIKSARVADKTVYFDLDSKIRKHLISVLKKVLSFGVANEKKGEFCQRYRH